MAGVASAFRAGGDEGLVEAGTTLGRGAIVAAGPWIFTVLSIAAIHLATASILTPVHSYAFRGLVIYAFALSLLATAPVVNVAIRQVADDIYLGDLHEVRPRLAGALILSALSSFLVCAPVFLYLGLSGPDLVVGIAATAVIGLIWPTLAFCGAARDYSGITAGFLFGLTISVVATVSVAYAGWPPAAMMAAFTTGLGIVFFILAGRVLDTFPHPVGGLIAPISSLLRGMAEYRLLAFGSATAIAAIWMDKWIMWFGPLGVRLGSGLVSAPVYDGAMFVSYLVIVPALGVFVTAMETTFSGSYSGYIRAIRERGPLSRVSRARSDMEKQAMRLIGRVLTVQLILCVVAAMAAPVFVSMVGLQFQQIGMLRLGLLATLFQFVFLACTSILLFFDQHARFLALQLLFLSGQAVFTLVSIRLGPEYYGFGHLVACAFAAFVAVVVIDRTFRKLDYLIFAAAVRQALGSARKDRPVPPVQHRRNTSRIASRRAQGGGPRPLLAR